MGLEKMERAESKTRGMGWGKRLLFIGATLLSIGVTAYSLKMMSEETRKYVPVYVPMRTHRVIERYDKNKNGVLDREELYSVDERLDTLVDKFQPIR